MKKRYIIGLLFISGLLHAQQVTGLSNWSLYLDPGHSQRENMGIYNYSEAEKNVRVALNLRDLFMTYTDIDTVYLCRDDDNDYMTLTARTQEANRLGVDWYHSIHSDAGSPDKNSTLLLWGQYSSGAEKVPRGGKAMSDIMIDKLTRTLRTNTVFGSIGDCSFYGCSGSGPYLHVNRESNMASELSEAGFHTNPAQNQRNMNAEWKRLEAWSFFWSILEYHQLPHVRSRSLNGIIRNSENGSTVNGASITLSDGQQYTTDTYGTLFNKYSSDPMQLSNGFYYFENVASETVELIVTAPGYYPDTLTASLSEDFHSFKDVYLVSSDAPYIVENIPENGDPEFPAWDPIVIYFSRPMDTLSVRNALSIEPAADYELRWNEDLDRLVILAELDFLSSYTLTLASTAADLYGHAMDGGQDVQIAFSTQKADVDPPKIKYFLSDQDFNNIHLQPVMSVIFDDLLDTAAMSPGTVILEEYNNPGSTVAIQWTYTAFDEQNYGLITVHSLEKLRPSTVYALRFAAGISDLFDNATENSLFRTFLSGKYDYSYSRAMDSFEAGVGNFWEPQQSGSTAGILTGSTSRAGSTVETMLGSGSAQSMLLNYGWDPNASSRLIRLYAGASSVASIEFNNSYRLETALFGDGRGNKFRFCVDDNITGSGAHEVSPWYTVDWYGWKRVTWDLSKGETGSWIGDGTLDGTMSFDSFQFSMGDGEDNIGSYYLDDFKLVKVAEVVSSNDERSEFADAFRLGQNYPNPFNGRSTIPFSLSRQSIITVTLYDLQGRALKTLAQGSFPAGEHEISLNSHGLSSGIYIYAISHEAGQSQRRLIILK